MKSPVPQVSRNRALCYKCCFKKSHPEILFSGDFLCLLICRFFLVHLLSCGGKHELDAVFLIYSCSARVIVNGNDIGLGIGLSQLSYHALAYDVVWKAAERLGTDDVVYSHVYHVYHLGGKEPALAHLVCRGDERLNVLFSFLKGSGAEKS